MKKISVTILALVAFVSLFAKGAASPEAKAMPVNQTIAAVNLSGLVFDKNTNECIAGAVITLNDQKIYSDLDGKFQIRNASGSKMTLKISMISYEDKVIEIDPSNLGTLNIALRQR